MYVDTLIFPSCIPRGQLANSVLESTDLDTDVLENQGKARVRGTGSQTAALWNHPGQLLRRGLGILIAPRDLTPAFQIPDFTKHWCQVLVINPKGRVNDGMAPGALSRVFVGP